MFVCNKCNHEILREKMQEYSADYLEDYELTCDNCGIQLIVTSSGDVVKNYHLEKKKTNDS